MGRSSNEEKGFGQLSSMIQWLPHSEVNGSARMLHCGAVTRIDYC